MSGNGLRSNFTDDRAVTRHADDKDDPIGKNGKQEIGNRARADNRRALPDGFIIERLMTQLGSYRFNALIEHFDIAAKGDHGDDIFGALAIGAAP